MRNHIAVWNQVKVEILVEDLEDAEALKVDLQKAIANFEFRLGVELDEWTKITITPKRYRRSMTPNSKSKPPRGGRPVSPA